MSTLKIIFDFLLSVVKVIFPGKRNGRHCHPNHTVPHPHRPNRPTPEGDGSGSGSGGSNPVDGKAREAKDSTGSRLHTTMSISLRTETSTTGWQDIP